MKKDKRKAPPVTTGYDPRAVERAPEFTDGHLPPDKSIPRSTVGADDSVRPKKHLPQQRQAFYLSGLSVRHKI